MSYHLAQFNLARMIGPNMADPRMRDFVNNLNRVNEVAEHSPGFVWRLKEAVEDPFDDEQLILNLSVWENQEVLFAFTYQTFHLEIMRRRKEWFQYLGKPHMVLWWIPIGEVPDLPQARERLEHLQTHGPSEYAFTFKQAFPMPKG